MQNTGQRLLQTQENYCIGIQSQHTSTSEMTLIIGTIIVSFNKVKKYIKDGI